MSSKRRKDPHFSLDSPVIRIGKESTSVSIQSAIKTERSPIFSSNLLPYTPPDALMFPLFSAIQRSAWVRARKLCYELVLCDPLRKDYQDLHDRIDQIVRIMNERLRPVQPITTSNPSRKTTAATGDTEKRTISSL